LGQSFSVRIVLVMLILFASAVPGASAAQTSAAGPMVNVLLFNYSIAPAEVLIKGTAEATRIFAGSGITVNWTYCPPHPSADSLRGCEAEPSPGEIRVRVLGRQLNNVFQDGIFGFAIAPTFASVYYESAQTLINTSTDSESYLPMVLGCLMAHEIGHLLRGENQHTVSGIMQSGWDIRQIQQVTKGALQFNPQQAVRMRKAIQTRANPPAGTRLDSTEIASRQAFK